MLVPGPDAELPEFEPVYPLTQGVTLKALTKAIEGAVDRAPDLDEWADAALVAERRWPVWRAALRAAHAPRGQADLAPTAPGPASGSPMTSFSRIS